MTIVGDSPESGVRVELTRPRDGGPPWHYAGEAVTPGARVPVVCTVTADGEVEVTIEGPDASASQAEPTRAAGATSVAGGEAGEIAERIRLLVRAVYKHAQSEKQAPPRRIVRWRADLDLASKRGGG